MIISIKKWLDSREELRDKNLKLKVYEIRSVITKYFEDLQASKGSVELPAWVECKRLMEKLHIDEAHPRNVEFYYRKIKKHRNF